MLTEEQLKEIETRYGISSQFVVHDDIRSLIAEVRRLNAAYIKLLHEINLSAAINSMPFYDMAQGIFEPELSD